METKEEVKYFGRLIFPETGQVVENTWLHIEGNRIYVFLPDPGFIKSDWSLIWGEFNTLGIISLLDCHINAQLDGFGGNYRKLRIHKLIQGTKLNNSDEKFLNSVNISCSALNDWIHLNEHITINDNTYTIPKLNNFLNIEVGQFKLEFSVFYRGQSSTDHISLKREISFRVIFNESISISAFYIWKRKFEKLIVFLTNENPALKINGLNGNNHAIYGINSNWDSYQFYYNLDIHYTEIVKHFEKLMFNWFNSEKLNPIINLLFEKKENIQLSIPRHFLNMCVASESFHLSFIDPRCKLKNEDSNNNRERIKNLIKNDSELLNWFRNKSSFWKNPDFIDRLKSYQDEFGLIIGDVFNISIDDLFIKIKNTRNKLAHEGKHNSDFKTEFSLLITAYSLELLLHVHVLKTLCALEQNEIEQYISSAKNNLRIFAEINNFKGIE